MPEREKNVLVTETYVDFAEYKPLERVDDRVERFNEKVIDERTTNNKIEDKVDFKDKDEDKVNIFKRPDNFTWRENVSKKYIKEETKIVNPKLIEAPKSFEKQPKPTDLSPQMVGYIKALIITIKNHWQIPEDVYNRLQGYSTELEIYIDESGFLRYKIVKPSSSKLFNEYSEDALRKTFSNLPPQLLPPKEFIDYYKNGGKIVIEFKL